MKRLASILTFLFLLILIIELRIRFVDTSASSSFVFMLLLTVISSLYWGLVAGVTILLATALVIAFFFLTPTNLTLLTMTDYSHIALFIVEGLIILLLMHYLKTGKEQEHELRERFQVILASIGDAVIATDKKGNIRYMNAAAQRLTGWRFHEAKQKKLTDVLHMEDSDDAAEYQKQLVDVLGEGKIQSIDKPLTFINRKGRAIDIQDTIAPLRNMESAIIGLVLIFRDVTEHREMEEQKEVLLGSISHELKNYITSIHGYTHLIRKKSHDTKDEKLISYTEKLYNKVDTMKNMIISMLDLSKLKMGKLDMETDKFDLKDLVTTIVNDLQINTKHPIKIKDIKEVSVIGDKIRIGQVLTNLLSNAIKYSPVEKEIHVLQEIRDGEVVIGVRDFGKGITSEKMEKIFKPFYRAVDEEEKNSIAGSGLGLYISKEIIKQHKGSIWVKSKEDDGSTFYFSIPSTGVMEEEVEPHKKISIISKIKELLKFEYAAAGK